MIYDYYDIEAYDKESYDFFMTVENYGKKNPFGDIYLSYLELSEDIKQQFPKKYEIDVDAYLFFLVRFYALKSHMERKKLLKHPYIEGVTREGNINQMHTVFGDVDFKFWIHGFSDVFKRSIENRGTGSIPKLLKAFFDEYNGAFDGKCHQASIQFCGYNNVVTAFASEPQSGLRFLHSFIENDERVLETTANIIMNKEDYYRLLKPEILTKIPGEELFELYEDFFEKHPRLKRMGIKQLLVEYDEVKRNPDTIKIKTYSNR